MDPTTLGPICYTRGMAKSQPMFFDSAKAFRAWLRTNHKKADELIVGYYKRHTGRPSMTWPESVAEALCWGWIDGIRRRVDEDRYTIRFTPRRKGSRWSAINVKMVAELEAAGKMTKAGRAAYEARPDSDSPGYTSERRHTELDDKRLRAFQRRTTAWKFFEAQPPSYRAMVINWIMSAKKNETKDRRLKALVESSAAKKRLF